jgi:hypothetical protein
MFKNRKVNRAHSQALKLNEGFDRFCRLPDRDLVRRISAEVKLFRRYRGLEEIVNQQVKNKRQLRKTIQNNYKDDPTTKAAIERCVNVIE